MSAFIRTVSLVWLMVASQAAVASVIIEVHNPPYPTDVPALKTRIQAIDYSTGQVAFDQTIDGVIQSATLSDLNEAVHSIAEIGTPIFRPRSSLFVQKIGGPPTSALLSYDGPIHSLGVSISHVVWKDDESIKARARADGTTQSFGGSGSRDVQISGNRLIWHDWNIYTDRNNIAYLNLDTGDYSSYLFWNRPVHSLTLAQHVRGSENGTVYLIHSPLAISNGQVYSDSGFGFSTTGGTQVPLYDDSGNAFRVVSLKTNGDQIAFKNYTERWIDDSRYMIESFLYLKNGEQILELSGPQSGPYALGTDAVAWTESVDSSDSLRVYDIPSGQTRTLTVDVAKFSLWDINGRYVLLTSQVVPEPGNLIMATCGALFMLMRTRCFVARRQEATPM